MAQMLIGKLATQLGLNPRTLRYYETLGLLPPPIRTVSGYRIYDEETLQRLVFVIKAKGLGITLKEIRKILAIRENGKFPCRSVQRLLQEHVERIDHQIAQLQTLKTDLTELLNEWHSVPECNGKGKDSVCPHIEAYGTTPKQPKSKRKGGEK
jgi:DNA-binding transcriptional MerR regulator